MSASRSDGPRAELLHQRYLLITLRYGAQWMIDVHAITAVTSDADGVLIYIRDVGLLACEGVCYDDVKRLISTVPPPAEAVCRRLEP